MSSGHKLIGGVEVGQLCSKDAAVTVKRQWKCFVFASICGKPFLRYIGPHMLYRAISSSISRRRVESIA